jgi:ATP-dependent RNA helicase DDX46/PRP5
MGFRDPGRSSNHPDAQRRYRDRDRERERDRNNDTYRRRDRSIDRRDDDYHRGGRRDIGSHRDRRRSRDRSPGRRRPRSRDGDRDRARRDDSADRYRSRREDTADSGTRSKGDDGRTHRSQPSAESSKSKDLEVRQLWISVTSKAKKTGANAFLQLSKSVTAQEKSEADKKAERLAKLEAWKKKHEQKQRMENDANAASTRKLLAEMDNKASGTPTAASPPFGTPAVNSPSTPQSTRDASPVVPYAGKFDPKAIAKKSAPRHHSPAKLGVFKGPAVEKAQTTVASASTASALPQGKPISGFGFHKTATEHDKAPAKRKLDLDDEEISKRKLAKLPDMTLEDADATPYVNQDEDEDDSDADNFAGTEEEAAAAARAAHDRREERILQQSMAMQTDEGDGEVQEAANGTDAMPLPEPMDTTVLAAEVPILPATVVEPVTKPEPEAMDVDDGLDPLDAFMAGLDGPTPTKSLGSLKKVNGKNTPAPETYFSDDDDFFTKSGADGGAGSILAMAAKRKNKKDIPTIDYSKMDIKPIRKNFWTEPVELSEMTETEVAELRNDLDGIKVSGKDVPKPVQKWSHCGLTRPILETIDRLAYDKPTPIQMQALPVIMSGRDVIGVAKTGSGKTMAFLLPMFRHIKDQDPVKDAEGPVGLVLTPTRELAVQIHRDCKPFAKALGLRAVCAYGGPPIKDQIAELKRGADIVVATTGRMIDLLAANQGRVVSLKRTTYIVLDEADRMFDMGFEPQVMKIFANIRPDRQTVLFSATMPRIIDALVKKVLRNPVEIIVGGKSVVAPEITQIVEIRDEKDKFIRLLEILGELYVDDDDVRALIFVERQEKADDLLRELLRKGYGCMSIHGGKDQSDRDSTIADFKSGVCPVLVATSVAARGLDVKQLKLVVNYDAPNHLEDYVHRAGRTGRAGNTGTAVTFITEEQENCAPGIAKALEQSGQPVPERLNEMRKAWREKVKAGSVKDQSGFGGKGLDRLDKEREAARMRERKTHKAEGEEDDFQDDTATQEDDKKQKAADAATKLAASAIVSRDAVKTEPEIKATPAVAAAAATGKGGAALDKAAAAINDINARLAKAGQLRHGQPIDNKGPDAGAFHATLEINDFPQKARWAVTNRTNVAKILEATGTSITTKGNFYAAGKEPPAGAEPKLYILIEGDTELVVGNALSELTRLLREGTMAAADAESRAPVSGRYTIT